MRKIKFLVGGSSSGANPPPPLPPPSGVAGGSGAGGPALPSTSYLSDQKLLISDPRVGNSSSEQNIHENHKKQIYLSLAVGHEFIQRCVGKRSSWKRKSRYCRRGTPQPSGFGGGSRSRNLEDNKMVVGNGSGSGVSGGSSVSKSLLRKRQRSAAEKTDRKKVPSSSGGPTKKHRPNDSSARPQQPKSSNCGVAAVVASLKKGGRVAWGPPAGIVIELTKEEKEEDFLRMTGAKLPQKPTRRPKKVQKDLLYCFPGVFLSRVSSSKYEVVVEKKYRKSKRRGLKGIVESSDSE